MYIMLKKMKKYNLFFWIVFFLCTLPSLVGIFHPGFFVSDDGHWMTIRLSAFYEALASGQFPVRFLPRLNQGLGYPVADFLYPLFLYIGSLLHVLKFSFVFTTKLLFAGSLVFSGVGMILFLRKKFSSLASFIGGIFYIYLPYHLYDVYARGSLGEVVALAIVPFILWAIENRSVGLSALFFALLILSHNTLALFFFPIIVFYALIRKMPVRRVVLFVLLGLGGAAFFWIPALYDKQYTVFDSIAVSNPFSYFVNTISFQLIGWIGIVIFGGIFFFYKTWKRDTIFFVFFGLLSIFFSLSSSELFWHSRPLAEFVQFPFRFLSLTLIAESFLLAYLIDLLPARKGILILLVLLLGFSAWPYLLPRSYDYLPDSFYATNVDTTTVKNEYMPRTVHVRPQTYAYTRAAVLSTAGTISNLVEKGTKMSFVASMQKAGIVDVSFVYFPGWQARVDGKTVAISPSPQKGLVQLRVPQGQHVITVWFGETPVRVLSDIVSILSFIGILFFLLKKNYEK